MDGIAGSNLGIIDRQHQGTGFGTVLDPSLLVELLRNQREDKRYAQAEQKVAQAKKDASMKSLNSELKDDWFFKMDQYFTDKYNNLWDEAASVMTHNNVDDVWTSSDNSAMEWRKKATKYKIDIGKSNQIKDWYMKMQSLINGDKADATGRTKYTQESKEGIDRFFQENSAGVS